MEGSPRGLDCKMWAESEELVKDAEREGGLRCCPEDFV